VAIDVLALDFQSVQWRSTPSIMEATSEEEHRLSWE
jgi:hypothetical protein